MARLQSLAPQQEAEKMMCLRGLPLRHQVLTLELLRRRGGRNGSTFKPREGEAHLKRMTHAEDNKFKIFSKDADFVSC